MKINTSLVISSLCLFFAFASAEDGKCDPGYYISGPGSCKKCPKGTFQDEPGMSGCKPCPDGTVSMEAGSTECTKCGENKEPAELKNSCVCIKGLVAERKTGICKLCEPGFRFSEGKRRNRCVECSAGFYQPLAGQMKCLKCPEGSSSKYGATECTPCSTGDRLIDGVCGTCPAGEYYSSGTCFSCNSGTFKAKAGFGPCLPCPPNTVSNDSASKCVPTGCPEGEAPMTKGKCGKCPAGTYYNEYGKKCEKCSKNYFMPYESIAIECFKCAGTSYTNKKGAKSEKECIKCPFGQRLLKSGECGTCPAGNYYDRARQKCRKCRVNEYSRGNVDSCQSCSVGSYALPGASTCFACPEGQALIGKKCGRCRAGRYYDSYNASCDKCCKGCISAGGAVTECEICTNDKTNKKRTECIDK